MPDFQLALFGMSWLAIFVWTAIMVGAAYIGGVLLAPNMPEIKYQDEEEVEGAQSRLWRPHTTQQEGIARPRSYGKNLHHGNIIYKWTDVVDNEREILHLLLDHGDGPTKGVANLDTDVFLNDQPASNFTATDLQQRLGTMNQTCMTGFDKPKLEYRQKTELIYDEPVTLFITPNDFFDDIEFTIAFLNGLIYYNTDGSRYDASVTLKVRIRPVGGGWATIIDEDIEAQSKAARFYKYTVSDYCAVNRETQYELEFSRTSEAAHDRGATNMTLRSVREVIDTAFTHPGRALVGIRAIATTQLSGNIDVKVIREDRIINVYDSVSKTWTLEWSNDRSMVTYDMASLPVIDGDGDGTPYEIIRYDGIDPQYLDLDFFAAWSDFCVEELLSGYGEETEPRCACNTILSEFTNIFDLISNIAAIGRAFIYWRGHLLTGWIDDEVTTPIDLVTMDSMMHKTWKNAWAIGEELAGVIEVFYKDEKQGFERTFADRANEDAGGFRNITSLDGLGIITRGSAIHYANYLLTRNQLIRNKNKFKVHKDGFRYKLGDTIRLQCRIANWGKAFNVVSSTADTITVDRDAPAEVSVGDALHIRTYDTVLKVVVTDAYVVDSVLEKVITVTENWDVTPVKGNLVATGITKLRRIIKMTPTIDNYFNVEVETYDVILFDCDLLDPSNPNPAYVWPTPSSDITPAVTIEEVQDSVTQQIAAMEAEIEWLKGHPGQGGSGGIFASNIQFTAMDAEDADWTERQPAGDADKDWRCAASDSDGSNLIAGIYLGGLYTSSNSGVDWTQRYPGEIGNGGWISAASDSDGSHLIVAIKDGRLYTSANSGVDWTERQPAGAANKDWLSVASDDDGSHLIAGVRNGRLYTSSDYGANWTERQPAGAVSKKWCVASDADGSHLIAGALNDRLYTSANYGINWTERQPAGDEDVAWTSVASDDNGSHLIAAVSGTGRIWTSGNSGASWTERLAEKYCISVASDNDGTHLMVGTNERLYVSDDSGINWDEERPAGNNDRYWTALASNLDGSILIAGSYNILGVGGRLYTSTFVGEDSIEWTAKDEDSDILLRHLENVYAIEPDSTALKYIYWNPENPNVLLSTDDQSVIVAGDFPVFCFNQEGVPYVQ